MTALKLAYRNLVGAGLRTWLNAVVLSFSFVIIIWHRGLLEGWNRQARRDMINWEIGGGQYSHNEYDPYDPFSILDSHGTVPREPGAETAQCTPILLCQATIYPEGRMQNILLKGINPDQEILQLPSGLLAAADDVIPAMVGKRMAANSKLKVGDTVIVRWRDANGTFDAAEAQIVSVFNCNVPAVDSGQMWIPLERLRTMLQMPGEATLLVTAAGSAGHASLAGWIFRDNGFLLADIDQLIRQKSVGGSVMYLILLALAMLAIFNTQVLSIFRRQKEIGTEIALGMTSGQVVRLFTVEGALHGVLAAFVAALYGIPLLYMQAKRGFAMPEGTDDYGMAIAEKIIPVYGIGLIVGTTLIVLATATLVGYLPSRRIARMNPTDAIRGKIQ